MKKVINHKQIYKAFENVDKVWLAKELGTSVNLLTQYIDGFKPISWKRALEIERLTGISKSILRPDIFGPYKKEVA